MAEELVTLVCEHEAEVHVYRLPRSLTQTPEARLLLQADYYGDRDAPPACIGQETIDTVLARWAKYRVRGKSSHDGAVLVCDLHEACPCAEGDPQGCAPLGGERKAAGEVLCPCAFRFLYRWLVDACDLCFNIDAVREPGGVLADYGALRAFWFRVYAEAHRRTVHREKEERSNDLPNKLYDGPFYMSMDAADQWPTAAHVEAALAAVCAAPVYRALCAAARDVHFEENRPATIALTVYLQDQRRSHVQTRRDGAAPLAAKAAALPTAAAAATTPTAGQAALPATVGAAVTTPSALVSGVYTAWATALRIDTAEATASLAVSSASETKEEEALAVESSAAGEVGMSAPPRDATIPIVAYIYAFDLLLLALDRHVPHVV